MLLTMMASTGTMWGQTRDTQTVSYGWETTDDATPWTISDAIVATSGQGNTGSYAGRINTNSTTVQFNEKVYVTSFSYAFKRTSTNNNYSVYIETSTDGSTWSIKDTQTMNTFTNGSYRTVTKEFDGSQELYVRFRCNNTTAVRYVDDVTITYATGASQLDPCDLTLTNASTSIVFDLYNNFVPFVINYTTSSTGTVSVAENDYVETVVDQVNKTITVTPIAITNGAKVITVNQAADDNYAAGSKTFTINITDSTPFSGGNVTFDATTDKGTSPLVKNGVTFACTNGVLDNGSEYRLYKNSVTTFSVTQGNITQIAFTGISSNPASGFGSQTGWTTNGDNGTWTGEATEVSFTASGAQVRATQIIVTVESSSDPAVHTTTTINVPVNFNTDIQQGTNAGTLTATVTVTSDGSEVSGATVTWESSNTSVATIDANGAVTLVAVGTTTITASYAGVEDQYKPSEGTYPLTVSDSNAPGTENNPYTVAAAMAATPASGTSNYVYIHGIVSAFYNTSIVGDGNNYRYYISDDGTTTSQLLVYKGKGLNNEAFSTADDLHIGDIVTIYGGLTMYQSAPEIASGNYLTAWERPAVDVEAPTFSVEARGYATEQTVAITCATDGAQIYYTTDGSTPDNTKTLYNGAITVSETQTIKAIAYVGENASAISTAAYYILSDNNTYTVAEALAFETYPQNNIFVEGIVSTAPTSLISGGMLTYYISVDGTETNRLQVYKGKNLGNTEFTNAGEIVVGDRVTIFGNVKIFNDIKEFDQGNYLVSLEGYTYPVINADNINIAHDATSGTINYTVEHYLAGTMTASTEADWISNFNTATNGQVSFTTTANPNEEARVAQVTLTFTDITGNFSTKVVTVTQAPHVNDYAELPFWFDGNRDEIATTDGLTQYGLGEDFGNEPHLNFDNEGDWVILKMNEAPGRVSFTISNEGFSSGTFKVQTSADGETYSDLAVYTSIDGQQYDTYYNFDENVRYIKWIYTTNGNGSVGLGTISVAKFVSPIQVYMPNPDDPSQMIISYTFETSSASYQGLWGLQINNTNIESLDQYSIVFCHSDGTLLEPTEQAPDWLLTNSFTNLQVNEYYATCTYYFTINANTSTSPREAYFRFKCVIDETSYYSLPVTVTQEGYVPQNYTVTFNTNGGEFVANQDFSSTSTNVVEGEHNLPSATKDGYTFMGWSDGTQTYAANAVYNVTGNVEFTAQWGSFEWVSTPLADLTAEDVFVIVGDNGDTYAMSNDNGTSNAPSAVEVTVEDNKLSGNIDANIQWNLSISDDGYMFYPNGDSESWLYCTNANNGLRIGTGNNKHFSLADDGYITITETTKQRYLGIYNSQDWRSYENTTGNIANQTFAFYKRVEPSTEPSITLSSYEIEATAEGADGTLTVTYENIPDVAAEVYFCDAEGEAASYDWITAEINDDNNVEYLIVENEGAARTAYFKVYALDDNAEDVYSDIVTVSQAAYEPAVANPVFSPAPGIYATAPGYLTITCATEGAKIYYAVDGIDPTNNSTEYDEDNKPYCSYTRTFKAIAYIGEEHSSVVTATYHINSIDDPYRPSDVDDFYEYPTPNVYIEGMISATPTEGPTADGELTYYISNNGGPEDQLKVNLGRNINNQPFNSQDQLPLGATVIIYGSVVINDNNEVEIAQGNYLISSIIATPSITENSTLITTTACDNYYGELVRVINILDNEIHFRWFESDGETETEKPDWIEISNIEPRWSQYYYDRNIHFDIHVSENTTGEERHAYYKIYGTGVFGYECISELTTVTQMDHDLIRFDSYTVNIPVAGESSGLLNVILDENYSIWQNSRIVFCHEDGSVIDTYVEDEPDWIHINNVYFITPPLQLPYTVDPNTGEERKAYFRVDCGYSNPDLEYMYHTTSGLVTVTQNAYTENFELFSGDLEEGDYLIVYNGVAMNNTVTNDRLQYSDVTIDNNVISTSDAAIVWHIAPSGDYWTIYNAAANAYAASTGAKNKAQMLEDGTDDKALWTASGTYDFVNKQNTANNVNATLRYNDGYGFACYATSTGGALSLYKKVDNTPTISFNGSSYNIGINHPTGVEITCDDIIVSQNNLTENITLTATKGTVTPNIILAGANPTEIVWSYTPTEAGDDSAVITASNGGEAADATFTIYFGAKTPHNITIASVEHGTIVVLDNKTTAIENENVDFTVTPNKGYVIDEITVMAGETPVDFNDYETFYRFQMPDSDVTISATFNELPKYTIKFYVNGELDEALTISDIVEGDSTALHTASTLTPAGFSIAGWAAEEGSTIAVADPYTPTDNVDLYALFQLDNAQTTSGNYVKVTEELTDWSGEYLIVYEDGNVAFNGNLETFDAVGNTVNVEIASSTIIANDAMNNASFTIAPMTGGYSIQGTSGKYIGVGSYANGLTTNDDPVANAISIDASGNALITITFTDGDMTLKYNNANNQLRFRYYKSGQQAIQLYKKESTSFNTITILDNTIPEQTISDPIPNATCVVVPNNVTLTYTGPNPSTPEALVVQEGGQLILESDMNATVQIGVSGYNSKSGDGWYLISSPVDNLPTSSVATGTYDLFAYDEATAYWWVDHAIPGLPANHTFTTLERGKGYLYANEANVNLNYAGTMKATNANITVDLSFECDAYPDLRGFNLVGNPFTRNLAYGDMTIIGGEVATSYLILNNDEDYEECNLLNGDEIKPGQGFFIQATAANQRLEFNPSSKDMSAIGLISIKAGDESFIDKAYIQIGGGNTLRKMTFGENTMVYVMNDDLDYAAARVEELAGTMPIHFAPAEDGFYTITVETKNIENLNYMHLIDNIKNTEIDLLVEPSYTFKASESDNADRFLLVFDFNNYTGVNENYTGNNFAYQIEDEIFVSGEGSLQVFDVLGRYVASYEVSGDKRISTSAFKAGVYILRMVGSEMKTQKIVIR